jgi:hypothetical protein
MLFPNHPAFAEIRPGMGYAPGARNFGYAPGARNFGDVSHMGYAAGARGMGAISASMKNLAVDDGINTNDIDLLDSLGATDQDMTDLVNGNITLTALYAKYGVSIPAGSTATAGATPPAVSVNVGQVPAGSTILYTAKVNTPPFTSAQNILDAISPQLPAHGMALLSSQVISSGSVSGPASFSATVMDSIGHALKTDAQSVLDGLIENFLGAGNLQLQSTVTVVSPGISASGTPAAVPSTDALSWLEGNALYIGLGIGALVLLNNFTGKKRR